MTISAARVERRGAGLLALVSIGILLASLMIGARVTSVAAVDDQAACERPLDIVLIIDRSGSMDLVTGGQSRLGWAKDAANALVTGLNDNGGVGAGGLHQVGLTTYGNRDQSDGIPAGFTRDLQLGSASAASVHAAIDAYSDSAGNGNTPFRFGMADGADNMLDGDRAEVDGVPVLQVLIFLSDGRPNPDSLAPGSRPSAADITAYLAAADQAYGIAIGPDGQGEPLSEPDLDLMHAISNPDPDNFRHVVDAASLPDLFADMQEELLCGDIQVTKDASAEVVAPGGSVTYTYSISNAGDTDLINVAYEDLIFDTDDEACGPLVRGADSPGNNDNILDPDETWNFTCVTTLEETTQNQFCASASFIGGGQDSACADATVVVRVPDAPAISIDKHHGVTGTILPGTEVTYFYDVENIGNVQLSNVEVTDLILGSDDVACEPVERGDDISGNDDNILDVGEIWGFSCSTSLLVTTANEACVIADVGAQAPQVLLDVAQAEQVEDCDDEEVEVSASPSPEQSVEAGTGTPEESQPDTAVNVPGDGAFTTILFSLVLVAALAALAVANVLALRRGR